MTGVAWFEGIDIDDVERAADRIRIGSAPAPDRWPAIAVDAGVVPDRATYYARLHEAALRALDEELAVVAAAADRGLVQLIRTHDAVAELANELEQRIAEVRRERGDIDDADARRPLAARLDRLAAIVGELEAEVDELEATTVRHAHAVAPNLAAMAGPMLAARLIAAAGSLDELARQPSSTVQVLGAESALFAHLRGAATSPKHGLIFMHPAVRAAPAADRGRVARALSGKLAIAARIDAYRGELEPTLHDEWEARLARLRGEEAE